MPPGTSSPDGFDGRPVGNSWQVGAPPIDTGHVVAGRYRLISALGNGGMGTVWLAEDEVLARRVAVKEVSPPADMTPHERETLRERTLREAQTAARLSHPNVVAIYDVVEDDGRPWIVMELVPSRSLRDVVAEHGPLTAQQAAAIGLQILAALNAAHALGIMHRDVKPGNVLIDATGRAVLADFGIARTQDSSTLTSSGMIVGSPSYIAPERARGERGGPESDRWSLGATLYALVEGRPAYDRAGALPTLMAVVNEDPDPPSRAGVLWPVIRGLLDHVPSRRLGPAETERMLREVAGAGAGHVSAPLPEFPAPEFPPPAGADRTRPGSSLDSAEHTHTLRPWDVSLPAEPEPDLQPPEPEPVPQPPEPEPLPTEPDPLPLPPSRSPTPSRTSQTLTPFRTSRTPSPSPPSQTPTPSRTEPDPDPLPHEPDPDALPHEPDPQPLPTEPDPERPPPEARDSAGPAPVTIVHEPLAVGVRRAAAPAPARLGTGRRRGPGPGGRGGRRPDREQPAQHLVRRERKPLHGPPGILARRHAHVPRLVPRLVQSAARLADRGRGLGLGLGSLAPPSSRRAITSSATRPASRSPCLTGGGSRTRAITSICCRRREQTSC